MKQTSKYKILQLIGKGQFGKVFAAIDKQNCQLIALKELDRKHLPTNTFLRELHFLVSLNHPNIVQCQGIEHYLHNRYLVMDYGEGGTLRHLIDSRFQLTLDCSLKLIVDILKGLEYAHNRGIIHRDIKPENIILQISDRGWTAKISDFGIAKLYQEINLNLSMGDTGSPAYMSPEQFYGQYTYSCDLYAVGVILYELVVGKRPFSGIPKDLMSAHLNQSVVIPPTIPFLVRSAISKSLQKLPHRRFVSASSMIQALQLARDALKESYSPPKISLDLEIPLLDLISTEVLPELITHLAIASNKVYLGARERLYIDCGDRSEDIQHKWKIPLDASLCKLEIKDRGCFITTKSSLYYLPLDTKTEQFKFFAEKFLPILSFPTHNLVSTINPEATWYATSYLPRKSKTPSWEIWQLPNCQLKQSQINRKNWHHLIALSRRYGLAIYQNQQQQTEFHLFNRRGNWLAKTTIAIQLDSVIFNPLFPQYLIATEINNPSSLVVIAIAKFQIQRISLNITPSLVVACPQGYLISDRQSSIVLIDGKDLSCQQFKLSLSENAEITAIQSSQTQLLVATSDRDKFLLHKFKFSN